MLPIAESETAPDCTEPEPTPQSGILYSCDCDLGSCPVRLEREGGETVADWQECQKCRGRGYFEGGDDD